jgi:hypothetical protein
MFHIVYLLKANAALKIKEGLPGNLYNGTQLCNNMFYSQSGNNLKIPDLPCFADVLSNTGTSTR